MARPAAIATMLLIATTSFAAAQEVCVVCSGPQATYRCTVEKSDRLTRLGTFNDKAVQAVCTKELARQGGHSSCTARRDAGPCDGIVRELSLASIVDGAAEKLQPAAGAPSAPAAPAPPVAPPDNKAAEAPKEGPPRTVEELAKRTSEQSKKNLQGVGDAAAKTWGCVASLFTKC